MAVLTRSPEFDAEVLSVISWPSADRSPQDWRDMIGIRVRGYWRKLGDAAKLAIAADAHDMFRKALEQNGSFW